MRTKGIAAVLVFAVLLPSGTGQVQANTPQAVSEPSLLDDLVALDGEPLEPTTHIVESVSSPHSPSAAALSDAPTFTFNSLDYTLRDLPDDQRPFYSTTVVPLTDNGDHDSTGVRMYRIGTKLYNHPLAQAHYGLQLLNSWVATGNRTYLDRAIAQAQRLIDTAVAARGAWYLPYPFDFALHGDLNNVIGAPWYSAMAQGEALALFVWLAELTGEESYRSAADMAFGSFLKPRATGSPWTVFVDEAGYLWFEEYAHIPPDRTYNGHNFALYGVQYYYAMTGDERAAELLRGALTTAEHYASVIRTPYGPSRYCITHDVHDNYYHLVNSGQLRIDYRLTGNSSFARLADRFVDDLPDYRVTGAVTVTAGNHTGYRFTNDGMVISNKTVAFGSQSVLLSSQRRTMGGPATYFLISEGALAGYWLQEIPGRSFVRGKLPMAPQYVPELAATVRRGFHVGLRFDSAGAVIDQIRVRITTDEQIHVSERAVINGVLYRLVTDGSWAGSYLPIDQTTGAPTIHRLAGADRYATDAAVVADRYAAPIDTVYVASGEGFADALAAGPVAAKTKSPILLVAHDRVPGPIDQQLRVLSPTHIVVLGGPGAVSDGVLATLQAFAPEAVTRLAGRDRFATAAAISEASFAPGVPVVVLASGMNFPDALAAVPLAAEWGAPILLTEPDRLSTATAEELGRLTPGRIVVVGGVAVVSSAVARAAGAYATDAVSRIAGADRYETAERVSQELTKTGAIPVEGFIASGLGYADALAIGPVAGASGSPILLTNPLDLPSATASELLRLGLGTLTAIGGRSVVSETTLDRVLRLWR